MPVLRQTYSPTYCSMFFSRQNNLQPGTGRLVITQTQTTYDEDTNLNEQATIWYSSSRLLLSQTHLHNMMAAAIAANRCPVMPLRLYLTAEQLRYHVHNYFLPAADASRHYELPTTPATVSYATSCMRAATSST